HPAGPGAAGGPRPLHFERPTRALARCSDREPGSGPAPGLRDVPPDGAWAETSRADPPLPLSPSRAAVGGGDSIAAHRRGSMDHNRRQIQILATALPKRQYYVLSPLGRRLISLGLGPVALSFVGMAGREAIVQVKEQMTAHGRLWPATWLSARGLDDAAKAW